MFRVITVVAISLLLQACTSAGPYVTNISSDGNMGLNIEKCSVHFNAFTGVVSTGDCTTQNIKLRAN